MWGECKQACNIKALIWRLISLLGTYLKVWPEHQHVYFFIFSSAFDFEVGGTPLPEETGLWFSGMIKDTTKSSEKVISTHKSKWAVGLLL